MHILIIDDHPMVVDAIITCLTQNHVFPIAPTFVVANTCKEAFLIITDVDAGTSFDLAIIDQSIPPHEERSLLNGGHLALLIKEKCSNCKIIMMTGHTEIIIIYDLLKKVEPHGFIIKSDINTEGLCFGVLQVVNGIKFHSVTVKNIIQEIWKKELMIDDINRQILLYLYKGYKIKELKSIVGLSVSSIKRRIAQMRDVFNASEDDSLVKEALLQGFL